MTVRLSTTVSNIERDVLNSENKQFMMQFYEFMKAIGTSERYQNNNLKAMTMYSKFFGPLVFQVLAKTLILTINFKNL